MSSFSSSSSFQPKMPAASTLFSAYASLSALLMLVRSVFNEFVPQPVRTYLVNIFHHLFKPRSNKLTLVIEESDPTTSIDRNQIYVAAELYLSTKITTPSTARLKISKFPKDKTLTIRFEKGEKINDDFNGVALQWHFVSQESPNHSISSQDNPSTHISTTETKFFELSFDKEQHKNVIDNYIPYILTKSKLLKQENRTLKLCTLSSGHRYGSGHWDMINLEHPSTFDTLAMDSDTKSALKADLDRFVGRREFYKRVGKAWKRGYLLYGPPGTGKSSLIAAIANYLKFDVFDLQLGNLLRDSDLRRILLTTANRSILVIEDIDCTVDIKNRINDDNVTRVGNIAQNYKGPETQMTLSGLLNFIDGLWSSCGDERIIIFTTNHKDKLDPALCRPGRMDMHIHMSYLTVRGFRQLVSNYLEIDGPSHRLIGEIDRLIETVNVTPAQVAEELMRFEDADAALQGVAKLLTEMEDAVENGHVEISHVGENGEM